jgi:hypothetical protein
MGPNRYLHEKAREDHSHDLRCEMAKNRRLSHRPRHRLSRRTAGKLGVLRLQLGALLKRFKQSQTAIEKQI